MDFGSLDTRRRQGGRPSRGICGSAGCGGRSAARPTIKPRCASASAARVAYLLCAHVFIRKLPDDLLSRPRLATHFDMWIDEVIQGRTILLRHEINVAPCRE